MTFGIIDIIVAATVVLSVLFALYRGLVRELLGITSWILAGFGALYCYVFLQPLVHQFIENETFAGIVAGATISLIVLVLMTLLNAKITSHLRRSSLSGLDRTLGLLFGIFRAGLLIAVVYIGASLFFSAKYLHKLEQNNITLPYIQKLAGWVKNWVPESIRDDFKTTEIKEDVSEKGKKTAQKIKKKVAETTVKEVTKQVEDKVKSVTDYQEKDRESLDKMIEEVMENMDE